MLANFFRAAALLFMSVAVAHADSLPLPPNLTAFSSAEGAALLVGAEAREAYFPTRPATSIPRCG